MYSFSIFYLSFSLTLLLRFLLEKEVNQQSSSGRGKWVTAVECKKCYLISSPVSFNA